MAFSFGGLGPASGGTMGYGVGSAGVGDLGFGSQGPAAGGTIGSQGPGNVGVGGLASASGSSTGSAADQNAGVGSIGFGGGEGGAFGLDPGAINSTLAGLSGLLGSTAPSGWSAADDRAASVSPQMLGFGAKGPAKAAESTAALAAAEQADHEARQAAAAQAQAQADAKGLAVDKAVHDIKAAASMAETTGLAAIEAVADEAVSMADASAIVAAAAQAKAVFDALVDATQMTAGTSAPIGSINNAHDEAVTLTFGINPDDGKFLGSEPGTLPSFSQVMANIAWGRSQVEDPRLADLSAEERYDLEVNQQMAASVASNAIVFGPVGTFINSVVKAAPPAYQFPVAIATMVAAARVINPVAQEMSDLVTDHYGQPNVVPGPGFFTSENLGDIVPSATSIMAGTIAQQAVKSGLLTGAVALGVAIPEPISTLAALATAIYVGSETFVATDAAIHYSIAEDVAATIAAYYGIEETPNKSFSPQQEKALNELFGIEDVPAQQPAVDTVDHLAAMQAIEDYLAAVAAEEQEVQLADLTVDQTAAGLLEAMLAEKAAAAIGSSEIDNPTESSPTATAGVPASGGSKESTETQSPQAAGGTSTIGAGVAVANAPTTTTGPAVAVSPDSGSMISGLGPQEGGDVYDPDCPEEDPDCFVFFKKAPMDPVSAGVMPENHSGGGRTADDYVSAPLIEIGLPEGVHMDPWAFLGP